MAAYVLRNAPQNDAIRYAGIVPGVYGNVDAFVAELAISFILMTTILFVSNYMPLAHFTPYFGWSTVCNVHNPSKYHCQG